MEVGRGEEEEGGREEGRNEGSYGTRSRDGQIAHDSSIMSLANPVYTYNLSTVNVFFERLEALREYETRQSGIELERDTSWFRR